MVNTATIDVVKALFAINQISMLLLFRDWTIAVPARGSVRWHHAAKPLKNIELQFE